MRATSRGQVLGSWRGPRSTGPSTHKGGEWRGTITARDPGAGHRRQAGGASAAGAGHGGYLIRHGGRPDFGRDLPPRGASERAGAGEGHSRAVVERCADLLSGRCADLLSKGRGRSLGFSSRPWFRKGTSAQRSQARSGPPRQSLTAHPGSQSLTAHDPSHPMHSWI